MVRFVEIIVAQIQSITKLGAASNIRLMRIMLQQKQINLLRYIISMTCQTAMRMSAMVLIGMIIGSGVVVVLITGGIASLGTKEHGCTDTLSMAP